MKKLIAITALSSLSSLSQALPLLDLDIGAGVWMPEYSGDLGQTSTSVDDLNFEEDNSNVFYAILEFPLPILPNIKVKHTDLSTTGLSDPIDFRLDAIDFTASSNVATDLDLSHTDLTLYYGLPEFFLDVDFGVTVRNFDGNASATGEVIVNGVSETQTDSASIDAWIPMLFTDIRLDLPFTGLYGRVEGNILSIDGNSLTDITASIGYNTDALPILFDLEFEAGYRSMDLVLDSSDIDLNADVSIAGPYLGMQITF